MIQSTFSNWPKSKLVLFCKELVEKDFEWEQPYDVGYDQNFQRLEKVGKFFDEPISSEDYQFIAKFMKINWPVLFEIYEKKDKSLYDKLVIPVPKEYIVVAKGWGSCTYDEVYEDTYTCYDGSWVRDAVYQDSRDGNWNYFEGRHIDTDYDNHELSDWEIESVEEKQPRLKESLLQKLVLENTDSVLDSLDRDSLLKMKSMIEMKLRSL